MLYGSELFAISSSNSNAANKVIATPLNYEIGPNDVIKLVVYGVQEYSSDLIVSKEGKIQVAGSTESTSGDFTISQGGKDIFLAIWH